MPNYVGPALGRLSETLYRGLSDIGKSRLASEELSLKRGKMEQEQRRYEEGAPIREFQRKQATVGLEKEQKLDEAFSVPAFAREASQADQAQGEMGGGFPKAYERLRWISTAVPKIAKALNAKYDPATGTLVNMDTGKPLTNRDFQDPITQQKLSGIVGILTDSDKYLQMESDIPEAKALIEQRAKNPVKYYLDELKVKTDYLNQLGTFGIPKGSLTELTNEVKRLQGKIEKFELTPEQRMKFDKEMKALDLQMKVHEASIAKSKERDVATWRNEDDGQIIQLREGQMPPATGNWLQQGKQTGADFFTKLDIKQQTDDIGKQIQALNKAKTALSTLDPIDKRPIIEAYLSRSNIETEEYNKNPGKFDKDAMLEAKHIIDIEIGKLQRERDKVFEKFKRKPSQAPTEGLTEGTPYGAGPGTQVATPGVAQPGQDWSRLGGGLPKGPIPSQGGAGGLTQPPQQAAIQAPPEVAISKIVNIVKSGKTGTGKYRIEDLVKQFAVEYPERLNELNKALQEAQTGPKKGFATIGQGARITLGTSNVEITKPETTLIEALKNILPTGTPETRIQGYVNKVKDDLSKGISLDISLSDLGITPEMIKKVMDFMKQSEQIAPSYTGGL